MKQYPFDRNPANEADVLNYYADAIAYRNTHKNKSTYIAMHVWPNIANPPSVQDLSAQIEQLATPLKLTQLNVRNWLKTVGKPPSHSTFSAFAVQ